MPETTPGKQAVLRYAEETDPGVTPTNPAFLRFSPEVQNVTLGIDKNGQESRDIGEVDVHEWFSVKDSYTVSVEFHVYGVADLFAAFLEFSSGAPKAYSLEYIPDLDAASPHYYLGVGWRPNNITWSVGEDAPWVVTVEFAGGTWQDPVTDPSSYFGTGSRETLSAYDTRTSSAALKHFSTAAVTLDGSAVAIIVNSLEVNIEHGVESKYTIGNPDPVEEATVTTGRSISGTVDLSLDDGASEHWARVKAYAGHTLSIPFGTTTGDPILTLTGVKFPNLEIESGIDTDILMSGVDFTAASLDTSLTVP